MLTLKYNTYELIIRSVVAAHKQWLRAHDKEVYRIFYYGRVNSELYFPPHHFQSRLYTQYLLKIKETHITKKWLFFISFYFLKLMSGVLTFA